MNVSRDQYIDNLLYESATERQMEILGEALNSLRKSNPDVAGRIPAVHRIIGMRNVLVHGYAAVDGATVWTAATTDVPALIPLLERLLAHSDGEPER